MTSFKKILIVLDDKTEITDTIKDIICKVTDDYTVIKISDDYSIPLFEFKKVLSRVKKIKKEIIKDNDYGELSEKIYEIVESEFDNYSDEIHDLLMSEYTNGKCNGDSSWVDSKVYPTIFIRDHKQDNKFRNKFSLLFPRIIQFLVDENNSINPGEERTDKIFDMNIDRVILISNSEENNQFGIEYIGNKATTMNIPMTIIMDSELVDCWVFDEPQLREELHIFKKIEMDSEEYKNKFRDSVKKLRKSYYDSIKNQNEMKIIEDLNSRKQSVRKTKIPTKSSRKKIMKKNETISSKISEIEILEESYD